MYDIRYISDWFIIIYLSGFIGCSPTLCITMVAADTGGGLLLEHDALEFDGEDYAQWRNLVNLWIKVTSVEKDKQGPFLILIMSSKALDIALELSDYNIDNLLAELDVLYGYNQSDHGFEIKTVYYIVYPDS